MEGAWKSSIDRTLRSTEVKLEQLQHRRDNYDRAKRRVDDYLGATPNHHDGQPALDMVDHDLGLPPPLPQNLRYRATRMAAPSPPAPTSANTPISVRPSNGLSSSPLQLVNAQVRGALLELELEKAKRADSVRELAYRTTVEIAEMRSLLTQLQTENEALKKSVRALEGRLGFGGSPAGLHKNIENGVVTAADGATSISWSGTFARATHDATMPVGPVASLMARVDALETGLARQQQQAEDRQTRAASALRELVKAELGSEVSQVRALAREEARDSAENLLKLRLSALQSSTQADLQKALHIASASETVAQHAQHQCRETEQRLSSHVHKLQAQLSEWQRAHSSDALGNGTFAALVSSQQEQERNGTLERRVAEQLRGVQKQLQEYRDDIEAQVDRLAQQHKALSGVVHGKADSGELLAVRENLEEHQRGGSNGWISRDEVTVLLREHLKPLHDEMLKSQAMARDHLDNTNAWRQQAAMRFAAVEATIKAHSAELQQDTQWQSCAREIQQLRTDMSTVQSRAAEAVRQAKAELEDAWDSKFKLLEERTQHMCRERQQQTETQLRQVQQTLAEQQEALQRTRVAGESAEERLRRTEAALAEVEASLPRAMEGTRAKCEALQGVVQQACVLPVTRVQQEIEEAQRKLQAMEEERIRLNSSWAQQLAEARQYHDERTRHTRELLEQRLAHHKELYEELRAQQILQRRVAEEQHELLMDRVRHAEQQQRYKAASLVAQTTVREQPPGENTPARAPEASTTTISTATSEECQHTVQLLVSRLKLLDSRLDAVEETCANVPLSVSNATTSVVKQLESLQNRVHADADDSRKRLDELEHDMELQLGTVSRKCSETEASIDAKLARMAHQLEDSLSPLQLVRHLAANESSVQHLALHLRDHLQLPPDSTAALSEARVHLAEQAKTLDVLQTSMHEVQEKITGLREMSLAHELNTAVVPSSRSEMESAAAAETAAAREEMLDAVRTLQEMLEEQRERQDKLEKELRHVTAEQLVTITAELAELKRVTDSLPLELAKLSDQCSALQSVQRQQLPTLQKYVQDVIEVVESNQSAQMDPIQLRLRAVEDRHKHLQARVEEVSATQEADAVQKVQDLHKKISQQQKAHEAVEEQLAGLHDEVAATRAVVDSLGERMAAAEEEKTHATDLQVAVPLDQGEEALAVKTNDALTTPDAVEELRLYMNGIDERLAQLEEQGQSSVSVTAEVLEAFHEQLQNVVARFAASAVQLTGNGEFDGAKETESRHDLETGVAVAVAATDGVSCSIQPPIHSLEDVLLFLLHQLHQLQQALRQLQANTVDTLEILEQHEESVAPLPMLQQTVDVMAATLLPLAEQLGVDASAIRAVSEKPQHHHHHHLSLFPPPRSSSSSNSSASENCALVQG